MNSPSRPSPPKPDMAGGPAFAPRAATILDPCRPWVFAVRSNYLGTEHRVRVLVHLHSPSISASALAGSTMDAGLVPLFFPFSPSSPLLSSLPPSLPHLAPVLSLFTRIPRPLSLFAKSSRLLSFFHSRVRRKLQLGPFAITATHFGSTSSSARDSHLPTTSF